MKSPYKRRKVVDLSARTNLLVITCKLYATAAAYLQTADGFQDHERDEGGRTEAAPGDEIEF